MATVAEILQDWLDEHPGQHLEQLVTEFYPKEMSWVDALESALRSHANDRLARKDDAEAERPAITGSLRSLEALEGSAFQGWRITALEAAAQRLATNGIQVDPNELLPRLEFLWGLMQARLDEVATQDRAERALLTVEQSAQLLVEIRGAAARNRALLDAHRGFADLSVFAQRSILAAFVGTSQRDVPPLLDDDSVDRVVEACRRDERLPCPADPGSAWWLALDTWFEALLGIADAVWDSARNGNLNVEAFRKEIQQASLAFPNESRDLDGQVLDESAQRAGRSVCSSVVRSFQALHPAHMQAAWHKADEEDRRVQAIDPDGSAAAQTALLRAARVETAQSRWRTKWQRWLTGRCLRAHVVPAEPHLGEVQALAARWREPIVMDVLKAEERAGKPMRERGMPSNVRSALSRSCNGDLEAENASALVTMAKMWAGFRWQLPDPPAALRPRDVVETFLWDLLDCVVLRNDALEGQTLAVESGAGAAPMLRQLLSHVAAANEQGFVEALQAVPLVPGPRGLSATHLVRGCERVSHYLWEVSAGGSESVPAFRDWFVATFPDDGAPEVTWRKRLERGGWPIRMYVLPVLFFWLACREAGPTPSALAVMQVTVARWERGAQQLQENGQLGEGPPLRNRAQLLRQLHSLSQLGYDDEPDAHHGPDLLPGCPEVDPWAEACTASVDGLVQCVGDHGSVQALRDALAAADRSMEEYALAARRRLDMVEAYDVYCAFREHLWRITNGAR